jgi:hypothetical protein
MLAVLRFTLQDPIYHQMIFHSGPLSLLLLVLLLLYLLFVPLLRGWELERLLF